MATIKERTLINQEYLKQYSPIPKNYNLDEVENYVKVAELIWVKPIIGDNFYDELLDEIEDNEVTDANSTLLLSIYPLLGFAVVYEALPFIWANVSEVGITLGHSDNSNSVELKDLDYILKHLRAQIEARVDNLKDFLKTHSESFPLYENIDDSCCKKNETSFKQLYTTERKNKNLK